MAVGVLICGGLGDLGGRAPVRPGCGLCAVPAQAMGLRAPQGQVCRALGYLNILRKPLRKPLRES